MRGRLRTFSFGSASAKAAFYGGRASFSRNKISRRLRRVAPAADIRLRKSRSASAAQMAAPAQFSSPPSRRDDTLLEKQDGIASSRTARSPSTVDMYEFWNWFDDRTWYPLGRVIGGTVNPGLTLTAGSIWWLVNALNIPLSVETVCVFTAPIFSAFASWATYLLSLRRTLAEVPQLFQVHNLTTPIQ